MSYYLLIWSYDVDYKGLVWFTICGSILIFLFFVISPLYSTAPVIHFYEFCANYFIIFIFHARIWFSIIYIMKGLQVSWIDLPTRMVYVFDQVICLYVSICTNIICSACTVMITWNHCGHCLSAYLIIWKKKLSFSYVHWFCTDFAGKNLGGVVTSRMSCSYLFWRNMRNVRLELMHHSLSHLHAHLHMNHMQMPTCKLNEDFFQGEKMKNILKT